MVTEFDLPAASVKPPTSWPMSRRMMLERTAAAATVLGAAMISPIVDAKAQDMADGADNFYKSESVTAQKVAFDNQYKMKVVGNLFIPRNLSPGEAHPAIVVGHPMGAVKEQSANLYAQKLAEQGFVTLSLDLSFWGDSEGQPRNAVLPDVYAEDFSAAVDFLGTQSLVVRDRIGVLGICAGAGFVISAAKIDPRMKAIATVSMVDMGSAARGMVSPEQRKQIIAAAAAQRLVEFEGGKPAYTGGTVHELTADTPPMQRDFYDFYRAPRGEYTPAGASRDRVCRNSQRCRQEPAREGERIR